jgi:hypothetical protein
MMTILLIILTTFLPREAPFYITLGKAPECKGYNICKIEAPTLEIEADKSKLKVFLERTETGHLIVYFQKSYITDKTFLHYFATGEFIIDEDVRLPTLLCEQYEIDPCHIREGRYDVVDEGEYYKVKF